MNIGFFGGTFDPIHKGHLALAQAARQRCDLGRILFVTTNVSPLKTSQPGTSYFHRYAMTVLATAGDKALVPSLLEAPSEFTLHDKRGARGSVASSPNYSIDTVRKLKRDLRKSDRLFFLLGIDAFKDIAKWREAEALFSECEAVTKPFAKQPASGQLVLPGVTVHLLDDVNQNISATAIRAAVKAKRPIKRFVPESVEEYIKKEGLYA
jgi:nicotinate-nucleotide adenylyltransferase